LCKESAEWKRITDKVVVTPVEEEEEAEEDRNKSGVTKNETFRILQKGVTCVNLSPYFK
jgi:hypothetical protein